MIFLAAALASAQPSLPTKLPPIDTCTTEPDFVAFRARLNDAVERRDVEALLALMNDRVRLSFGGSGGKADFRSTWAGPGSRRSDLWTVIGDAIALGCAPHANSQTFPSMFAQNDAVDGFTMRIARPGARLRAGPSLNAKTLTTLKWDILRVGNWRGGDWIPVRTLRGRSGYIHRSASRSPIDHRLVVQKIDGRWQITAFIAGD